jgi:hypothetical protein
MLRVFMLRDGHLGWWWAVAAAEEVAVSLVEKSLVRKNVSVAGEQCKQMLTPPHALVTPAACFDCNSNCLVFITHSLHQWLTEGVVLGGSTPRNSEILTKYKKLRKFYYMKWNFL